MNISRTAPLLLAAALAAPAVPAFADEGMWTFNDFPAARVQARYGFLPTQAWLDHLRLASVRLAGGCSASIVSPEGLVMTNHHCARRCVETLAGLAKKDYEHTGFLAHTQRDEVRCPDVEVNQLTDISDVTVRVTAATQGLAPAEFANAQKAVTATIEKECATSDELRCEVVTLFRGGRYDLYRYRRLQDVRLAFAPEAAVAFFGGDPDNFMFPRYDLDVTFLRLYGADGKPMQTPDYLAWSSGMLKEGDLTFVAGNPGNTSRGYTVAQLEDDRDFRLPKSMNRAAELRGFVTAYQARGPEQKRHSQTLLFGIENQLKVLKGQHQALADKAFYGRLAAKEQDFRARVEADPALAQKYGLVWPRIAAIVQRQQADRKAYDALERGMVSELFETARRLVRYAAEMPKPNGERLREYSDARLPQLRQGLMAERPTYAELEIATLGWSLAKLREDLGPDHPLIKRVFGNRSAQQVAQTVVQGSRLGELRADATGNAVGGYRKTLFDGGPAAIELARDPMLELARALDADARAARKRIETEVEGPLRQEQERLADARLAAYSERGYPDATFTPRVSYGSVAGFREDGVSVPPFTVMAGAFERHTGAEPFELPRSWLAAKGRLDLQTPMNFVTTNDIIGGNSGSPMVDRNGDIVGLVFDGNIHSLGGDYGFDESVNRTVAVHSAALIEALDKVYGAGRLVAEIGAAKGARPARLATAR